MDLAFNSGRDIRVSVRVKPDDFVKDKTEEQKYGLANPVVRAVLRFCTWRVTGVELLHMLGHDFALNFYGGKNVWRCALTEQCQWWLFHYFAGVVSMPPFRFYAACIPGVIERGGLRTPLLGFVSSGKLDIMPPVTPAARKELTLILPVEMFKRPPRNILRRKG